MNFLVDTNIIIPLEPTSHADLSINTQLALKFQKLIVESGNKLFIHPAITYDLERDRNHSRLDLRKTLIDRYCMLSSPPSNDVLDPSQIVKCEKGTNGWVDNQLLSALKEDLVDYLVTEDIGIHKKSKRLGLENRVLLLEDAVAILQDLFDVSPPPPPIVEDVFLYQIDHSDPIFSSLRIDYRDFNAWFLKCKREQRRAYVVREPSSKNIAAIVILKKEKGLPNKKSEGKTLKLCTFKVSEDSNGNKLGELLLKTVFEFIKQNNYELTYFTVFPKHDKLIEFAKDFGFMSDCEGQPSGEIVMYKDLRFSESEMATLAPLEFNIKYGPMATSFKNNTCFLMPIRPAFHSILFPEYESQRHMFQLSQPYGNSIRKAYLSRSLTNQIEKGDNILFYRSKDLQAITCIGIVEDTLRSDKTNEIARYVSKRTVYSYENIRDLCKRPVLAIQFRLVRQIQPVIPLATLLGEGIINGPPQSITKIGSKAKEWIKKKVEML